MLIAILGGLGVGIILSFLTGPVFFALLKTSVQKGFQAGIALASGVLLGDIIYVIITFFGARFIPFKENYSFLTSIIGGLVLMAIGLYYVFSKPAINLEGSKSKLNIAHAGDFINGFILCFFNPSVLIFWLTVNGILKTIFHIDNQFDNLENIVFFSTVLATCFSFDILKVYAADKLRNRINKSMIRLMNRIAGFVIMFFGIRLMVLAFVPNLFGSHKKAALPYKWNKPTHTCHYLPKLPKIKFT